MQKYLFPTVIVVAALLFIIISQFRAELPRYAFVPTESAVPSVETPTSTATPTPVFPPITVTLSNLSIPWDIAFLPDGSSLVTERTGTVRYQNGKQVETLDVPGVRHVGEGGLLGIVLHPKFRENGWVYLYLTKADGDAFVNRIARYRFDGTSFTDELILLDGIPGATYHDGGRLAFGPDGYLYATTGDASKSNLAQDLNSLAGKILRMTDDGKPAPGNPFGTYIYSYGHRNPQGLVWDSSGRLWATEHGRSGVTSGYDEVNRIEPGKNYGWPTIEGPKTKDGMVSPEIQSGANETWAPSGMAIIGDKIFYAGLRGESLYEVTIGADGHLVPASLKAHFRGEFGRLRAVVLGPDGALYLTTSNTDGRGFPKNDDDKVIRVDISALK